MKYILDTKGQDELIAAMKATPGKVEVAANKALHTTGGKEVSMAIIGFMPKSDRNKKHAKDGNALNQEDLNLGFRIYARGGAARNKGSYGYLVFPNEGRGRSNPVARKFFEEGLESREDKLILIVLDALAEGTKI